MAVGFDSGSVFNIYWPSGVLQTQIKERRVGQAAKTARQHEELIPDVYEQHKFRMLH
jgi:hypothetical protein